MCFTRSQIVAGFSLSAIGTNITHISPYLIWFFKHQDEEGVGVGVGWAYVGTEPGGTDRVHVEDRVYRVQSRVQSI